MNHAMNIAILNAQLFCLSACASMSTQDHPKNVDDLHANISMRAPELEKFEDDGPFDVASTKNFILALGVEKSLPVDIYRCRGTGKIPIAIIVHGNYSSKSAHARQAASLASWGFHVLVLELPNRSAWLDNSNKVYEVASFLHRWPGFLGESADGDRVLLVGHSFGGSAVTLAAGRGAPVSGLVLLDPAVVHPMVRKLMPRVTHPVVLLGADKRVFLAKGRESFHQKLGGDYLELSVIGATHDDAQSPSMFSRFSLGVDPFTDGVRHNFFSTAIVVSAISIASSGSLDLIKRVIQPAIELGSIEETHMKSR